MRGWGGKGSGHHSCRGEEGEKLEQEEEEAAGLGIVERQVAGEGRGRNETIGASGSSSLSPQHHSTPCLLILRGSGTPGVPIQQQPARTVPLLPGTTDPVLPTPAAPVSIPAPLPLAQLADSAAARRPSLCLVLWPQRGLIPGLFPRPSIRAHPAAAPGRVVL